MDRTTEARARIRPADGWSGCRRWRWVAVGALVVATIVGAACTTTDEVGVGTDAGTTTSISTSTGSSTDPDASGGPLVAYPDPDWPVGEPLEHGLDPADVEELAGYLGDIGSDCLAIVKDGYLVESRYWNDTTVDTNQETWSISKSITSTLVGIAQDQGLLDIDEPASTYVEEWQGTPSEDVTIRNLLSNDSGRRHSLESFGQLVVEGDKTAFAIGLDQQHPPGTSWEYNSSAIQTLEAVLESATGRSVEDFAQENLFAPIGMSSTILDDEAGNDLTFMGTQAGCDDIARFGYLTLHDGAWDGDQIVSEGWMDEATAASQDLNTGYGFLWWRNSDGRRYDLVPADDGGTGDQPGGLERVVTDDGSLFFANAPPDLVAATGIQDQILLVSPSEDLVIVRLGGAGGPLDHVRLVDEIFQRLKLD